MSNPLLAPYPHPGKFEGELQLAQVLWDMSMDGADESLGDSETFGYHVLLLDLDKETERLGDLGDIRAAILSEGSQGFVYATYYQSNAAARKAWDGLEADWTDQEADCEEFYVGPWDDSE